MPTEHYQTNGFELVAHVSRLPESRASRDAREAVEAIDECRRKKWSPGSGAHQQRVIRQGLSRRRKTQKDSNG
ncbi:hypothetical protein ACFL0Y_03235 [Patescibacteria group bacterium]